MLQNFIHLSTVFFDYSQKFKRLSARNRPEAIVEGCGFCGNGCVKNNLILKMRGLEILFFSLIASYNVKLCKQIGIYIRELLPIVIGQRLQMLPKILFQNWQKSSDRSLNFQTGRGTNINSFFNFIGFINRRNNPS